MRAELVTTLKLQATDLLNELERDKQRILLTQQGLTSSRLIDAESCSPPALHMAVLNGIMRGEMAVAEGGVLTHAQAKVRMVRWLK